MNELRDKDNERKNIIEQFNIQYYFFTSLYK